MGSGGSGTIFFARCNLGCIFCQNYSISQHGQGQEVDGRELSTIMLSLQDRGCENINLVTPTHVVPQVLEALELAAGHGLRLPLVYNCGGYESLEVLRLLDGIIDIYMPDMKYSDSAAGRRYSGVEGYAEVNRAAVREMHRQVGDLLIDDRGLATRGLLVRHLVLPGGLAGTERTMSFLAREVSPHTYVNIMAQYRPCHLADRHPPLDRGITGQEYHEAVALALRHGLTRLDQDLYPRPVRARP